MKNITSLRAALLAATSLVFATANARICAPFDLGWEWKWGKTGEWKNVDLPHDAQFAQPWGKNDSSGARGFKPMGEAFYRKNLNLANMGINAEGKSVFLEFGGIMAVGEVYVNGKQVASTEYGYLPVSADITECLKDGDNLVEVRASTGRKEGSRWYTGAGLYRDAKIVVKPEISIARNGIYVISRNESGTGKVDVTIELDGFEKKGRKIPLDVVVEIKDAKGAIVATSSARAPWSKNAHQEVRLPTMLIDNAALWDIDSPALYTAEARLIVNEETIDNDKVRFGIRNIELSPEYGLKLNGRKVFLKSMSNHHDMGCVGVAAYRRAIERQFKTMKAFGYNAIRCSHNPYSEDFYELADEMGLLVLDELIDKWSDGSYWIGRKPFTTMWPQMVTTWMKRDRNHPCIFAWSFGNELQMRDDLCGYTGVNDWGVTMYRVIKAFSQRWDTTRPTTVAMYPARAGSITKKDPGFSNDPHAPELSLVTDFASFNYQSPAYANYKKHAPNLNIFQSEAEAYVLQRAYLNMDIAHSIGCSYWGAIEYWGESNGWPKKGWNYSFFRHTLEPKPAAYLIKSVMSEEPVVRIAVKTGEGTNMNWNDVQVGFVDEESLWEGKSGETKTVRVYTNQPEAELFLNGKSLGKKQNDTSKPETSNIITWEVAFEPGELTAKCGAVEHSVRTAGEADRIDVEVEADDYVADGKDLIYIKCRAVDKNGTQVRSWSRKVTFKCTGAAQFLCCDNGDHYTDELFTPEIDSKNMKDGFILAVFRTGTAAGTAEIEIIPDGLDAVTKSIKVSDCSSALRENP